MRTGFWDWQLMFNRQKLDGWLFFWVILDLSNRIRHKEMGPLAHIHEPFSTATRGLLPHTRRAELSPYAQTIPQKNIQEEKWDPNLKHPTLIKPINTAAWTRLIGGANIWITLLCCWVFVFYFGRNVMLLSWKSPLTIISFCFHFLGGVFVFAKLES